MARRTALLLRCAARLQGRLGRGILLRHLLGHAPRGARTGRWLSDRERHGRYAAVAQAEGIGLEDGVPERAAQHGPRAGRSLGIHHAARPLVSGVYADCRSKWGVLGSAALPAVDRISLFDAFLYWGT